VPRTAAVDSSASAASVVVDRQPRRSSRILAIAFAAAPQLVMVAVVVLGPVA